MDSIPVGESEIRGCYRRELPGRRHQYVRITLIRCHIHVSSSLDKRLSLDALACDDPQKTSQRSHWILPPRSLPVFGDLPLPFRSGAPFGWSSRLRFYWIPDSKLCKALQVRFHPKAYLRAIDSSTRSGKLSVEYWPSRHFQRASRLRSALLMLLLSLWVLMSLRCPRSGEQSSS